MTTQATAAAGFSILRMLALGLIVGLSTCGWMGLGASTSDRLNADQSAAIVGQLWGVEQVQYAPHIEFYATQPPPEPVLPPVTSDGTSRADGGRDATGDASKNRKGESATPEPIRELPPLGAVAVELASGQLTVNMDSEVRRKGLIWHPLYAVQSLGEWTYVHENKWPGEINVSCNFPRGSGTYDDVRIAIDGVDRSQGLSLDAEGYAPAVVVPVESGQRVVLSCGYKSRGARTWQYEPGHVRLAPGVTREPYAPPPVAKAVTLRDFSLNMTTDFADIDFPAGAMSPTRKVKSGNGWKLDWTFSSLLTSKAIGIVVPTPVQPGELAASIAWSAPVSLSLFFFVLFVISVLRRVEIHPINYAFIAAAFFSFHLLFAYLVDHIPIEQAFAVCSVVSMVLVVSYMRLVVSARFAFVEVAFAQLVYLIGFAFAHFWKGSTGLTLVVLGISTLFVMMQLTGRIGWAEVFVWRKTAAPSTPGAPSSAARDTPT